MAFVALLAALTGTAVALPGNNSVTSGDIKNGQVKTQDIKNNNVRGKDVRNSTLTGSDVRNNSLTGADINEGSLGTVPRATAATFAGAANAASVATNAGAVDGVSIVGFNYRRLASGSSATVLNAGGLAITATCSAGGILGAEATTTRADSHIQSSTTDVASTGTDNENQDAHFNPGETHDLFPDDEADQVGSLEFSATDGSRVSVSFQGDSPSPPPADCVLSGHAFVSAGLN